MRQHLVSGKIILNTPYQYVGDQVHHEVLCDESNNCCLTCSPCISYTCMMTKITMIGPHHSWDWHWAGWSRMYLLVDGFFWGDYHPILGFSGLSHREYLEIHMPHAIARRLHCMKSKCFIFMLWSCLCSGSTHGWRREREYTGLFGSQTFKLATFSSLVSSSYPPQAPLFLSLSSSRILPNPF